MDDSDACDRLFEREAPALSDAELLALILQRNRSDSHEDAGRLLGEFGGVSNLARATASELLLLGKLKPHQAAALAAALELGRRAVSTRVPNGSTFRTSAEVFGHFRGKLSYLAKEIFLVLLLDAKHRKLREVQISEGSLTAAIVHPREVFAPAVRESAAALILVHNHPSGDPAPSPEDVDVTKRLREVGEILGIRVLDHVIVGADRHFSFVDAGYW